MVLVILALIAVQVLFGINYVVSKVIVTHFPPLVWASFRIIIAASFMLLIAYGLKRPFPKGGKAFFIPLIGLALLGAILNQGAFLIGLSYTTSTNAAILSTLIPVFTFLVVSIRGQEKMTPARVIGLVSAFLGVLIIRDVEDFTLSNQNLIGDLLVMFNCLCYGLFLSFGKKIMQTYDRLWVTAWIFTYGSVGLTGLALPQWIDFEWPTMTTALVGAMVFAILGGTLLNYFLNNWALAYARPSQVAIFIYIQPVIAAALAYVWLDETITLQKFLSSVMIFLGVILVAKREATSSVFRVKRQA